MIEREERTIRLADFDLSYTLKNSCLARNLRLEINYLGAVTLVKPVLISLSRAEEFLITKRAWLLAKIAFFKKVNIFSDKSFKPASRSDFFRKRLSVEKLIRVRLLHFNSFYKFSYNKVSVRNQKTRWGSCSRRGALSFNVRLGDLADDLRDYIIVHELCHLKEFNHSLAFWKLVSKQIPDYKNKRLELKTVRLN